MAGRDSFYDQPYSNTWCQNTRRNRGVGQDPRSVAPQSRRTQKNSFQSKRAETPVQSKRAETPVQSNQYIDDDLPGPIRFIEEPGPYFVQTSVEFEKLVACMIGGGFSAYSVRPQYNQINIWSFQGWTYVCVTFFLCETNQGRGVCARNISGDAMNVQRPWSYFKNNCQALQKNQEASHDSGSDSAEVPRFTFNGFKKPPRRNPRRNPMKRSRDAAKQRSRNREKQRIEDRKRSNAMAALVDLQNEAEMIQKNLTGTLFKNVEDAVLLLAFQKGVHWVGEAAKMNAKRGAEGEFINDLLRVCRKHNYFPITRSVFKIIDTFLKEVKEGQDQENPRRNLCNSHLFYDFIIDKLTEHYDEKKEGAIISREVTQYILSNIEELYPDRDDIPQQTVDKASEWLLELDNLATTPQ